MKWGTAPESKFIHGILANRKAGEPPFTLVNYFPKDFLLVIDESHVTLPQIRGDVRW